MATAKKTATKKPAAPNPSTKLRAGKAAAPEKKVKAAAKDKAAPAHAAEEKTAKTGASKKDSPAKVGLPVRSSGTKAGVIRIRLSAFDHTVLDEAAGKIIEAAERSGAVVHGPVPLPTHIRKFTVNRSTFVHKDARDQFEMRTHRRLIDLTETTFKTVESLQSLSLPSGVEIEIKMG